MPMLLLLKIIALECARKVRFILNVLWRVLWANVQNTSYRRSDSHKAKKKQTIFYADWKFQKLWLMNALETAADSTQHAWLGQSTAHRSRFRSSVIASAPSQCVDVGVVAVTNWTANFITHLCCWWQLRISWWIHCPIFLSDERWIIFFENHVGYGAKCVIPRNNCDNDS